MGIIEEKIDKIIKTHPGVKFAKGSIVLESGSRNDTIYYIRKGYVRQYLNTKEGKEITVNIFGPGNIFPVSPLMGKQIVTYSYIAYKNVEIIPFAKDDVLYNIKNDTELMMKMLRQIYEVNSRMSFILVNMLGGSAYRKIIAVLYMLSLRFGELKNVPFKITHAEIAALTGLSRETVTREMKNIKSDKLIDTQKNKIVILDLQKIKSQLE